MPEYETIPAEEENAKPKSSLRRVIVCAAALSFVLGAVAATAVGSTFGDATEPPSDDEPTSAPTPSLCAAENCAAPGACLIIDGHKHGVPNKFHCEVNPLHFTDASVCEGPPDRGIWCDAPP